MRLTIYLVTLVLYFSSTSLAGQSVFSSLGGPTGSGYQIGLASDGRYVAYKFGETTVYNRQASDSIWHQAPASFPGFWNFRSPFMGKNGKMYAVAYSGDLYESTSAGDSWTQLSNIPMLATTSAYSLEYAPNGMLFLTGYNSSLPLYRSVDNGQTLEDISPDTNAVYNRLGLLPNGELWVMGQDTVLNTTCVWLTSDQGNNWVKIRNNANYGLSGIWRHPNGSLFYFEYAGNYRSNNNGQTWVQLPAAPAVVLNSVMLPGGRLVAHGYQDQIYQTAYSDDAGTTWAASHFTLPNANDGFCYLADGALFAYGDRTFRSDDGGVNFYCDDRGIKPNSLEIQTDPNGRLWVNNHAALWRRDTAGGQWTEILENRLSNPDNIPYADGLNAATRVAFGPDSILYVKIGNHVFRSNDDGLTYTDITPIAMPNGQSNTADVFVNPYNYNVYVSIFLSAAGNQRLYRSTNNGNTWALVSNTLIYNQIVFLPNNQMLAKYGSNWRRSASNGTFWLNFPALPSWVNIVVKGRNGRYYGLPENSTDNRIMVSDSLGLTWTEVSTPASFFGSFLAVGNFAVNAAGHLYGLDVNTGIVYRSFDDGANWSTFTTFASEGWEYAYGLYFDENNYLYTLAENTAYRSFLPLAQFGVIHGNVRLDLGQDCMLTPDDPGFSKVIMEADGLYDFYGSTDSVGNYTIIADTGAYVVRPRMWSTLYNVCNLPANVHLSENASQVDSVDFLIRSVTACAYFEVSASTSLLRICAPATYNITYCNYGTGDMADTRGRVVLDPRLDFLSSVPPPDSVQGDTLYYSLGTVAIADCGTIALTVAVNCDSTELGETLCLEAAIFPDTACIQANPNWSGAHVEVHATCEGDTLVNFQLINTTGIPTAPSLEYIIIEDQIVLRQGAFQLGPFEVQDLAPEIANGATWRIEAEQEPNHPGFSTPVAFVEGCNGLNIPGLVNQLPLNDGDPFIDIDCREVQGSYDPNDKQGFPTGVNEAHFIRKNTALEYLIRFQNTGTDTAFNIVLRDTLSALLDAGALRMGASSHPCTWSVGGKGVLTIRFDNIHLPDSNINEATSHGWVRFRIEQKPDLPTGSVIHNQVGIYFDYNDVVMTNQTWHTIGEQVLTLVFEQNKEDKVQVSALPNPFESYTNIHLKGETPGSTRKTLRLYNAQGQLVREQSFTGTETMLERGDLQAGIYFFQIIAGREAIASGKAVVR